MLGLTSLACLPVQAAEKVVLTTGVWPPYIDPSLPGKGFCSEIVQAAARAAGYEVEIRVVPWARAEQEARGRVVLGTYVWAHNEERDRFFVFTDTFSYTREKFFYLKGRFPGFAYVNLSSFLGHVMGGTRSYGHVELMQQAGLSVDVAESDEVNLRKLMAGRIDFFPVDELVGEMLLRRLFGKRAREFAKVEVPLLSRPMGVMLSKDHPMAGEFIPRFNRGLKQIRQDGEYLRILQRNGINPDSQR